MRTLYRNAVLALPGDDRRHTALAVEDGRVAWRGDEDGAAAWDGADQVVDLETRVLTPAFVDAHVHLVQTGDQLVGLDLSGVGSLADCLDRIAAHLSLRAPESLVVGQSWDESLWPEARHPSADDLERIAPGRRILLSRVDGHSAVASHALLAEVPEVRDLRGFTPDGRLERQAKAAMTDLLGRLVPPEQRAASARVALREMARLGIAAFHENAAPHIGPEGEIQVIREAADEVGLHGTYYWGEHLGFDALDRLGVAGLAGDLNADGAFGSRTAALRADYADAPSRGHGFLDAEQIAHHVAGCTERGVQAGFHCIGDAALDAIAAGFRQAADRLGADAVRRSRHRLEHCEMPSPEAMRLFAELGVVASVQPMFDALWGGPDRMYAARLGERWREVNPLRALVDAGVALAFGSDSPVTTLDPWAAARAAVQHRTPGQGLTPLEAFTAHTRGGWAAAGLDGGVLEAGRQASFAVWDTDTFPDLSDPAVESPGCLRTVVAGRTVHEEQT